MGKPTLTDIATNLGLNEKENGKDQHVYGVVSEVHDGSYEVKIAGSDTPVTCSRLVGAKPGDVVLVTIFENGHAVITNRVDGDNDALEAKEMAKEVTQHFWTDDTGVHISNEVDENGNGKPDGAKNSWWHSLGMLFRKGVNNIVAILAGNAPDTRGMAIYDGNGNEEGNIIAKFMGDGIRIGNIGENKAVMNIADGKISSNVNGLSIMDIGVNVDSATGTTDIVKYDPIIVLDQVIGGGYAATLSLTDENVVQGSCKVYERITNTIQTTFNTAPFIKNNPEFADIVSQYVTAEGATTYGNYEYYSIPKSEIPRNDGMVLIKIDTEWEEEYPINGTFGGINIGDLNSYIYVVPEAAIPALVANGYVVKYDKTIERQYTGTITEVNVGYGIVAFQFPDISTLEQLNNWDVSRIEYKIIGVQPFYTFGNRKKNKTVGKYSLAIGDNNAATDLHSTVLGYGNTTTGVYDFVCGTNNDLSNSNNAIVFGLDNTVKEDIDSGVSPVYLFGIGLDAGNVNKLADCGVVFGTFNKPFPTDLFQIGNGKNSKNRSNLFTVFDKHTGSKGRGIWVDGKIQSNNNVVLWSGKWWMKADQIAELKEPISAQNNGITLVWSLYDVNTNTANDWGFIHSFIPKWQVKQFPGKGHSFFLTDTKLSPLSTKYIYISNTSIKGNNDNIAAGTNGSGIKYNNKRYVLRAVIGV